jgi:hypothetical protein
LLVLLVLLVLLLLLLLLLLQSFALLVLTKPIDSNLWYCLSCSDGGELLCCDGCPAAYHTTCLGGQAAPQPNSEWLCGECLAVSHRRRGRARGRGVHDGAAAEHSSS